MASIAGRGLFGGVIDGVDSGGSEGRAQQQEARHGDNDGKEEWIYVLELEDGCIYVGKTTDPDARLEQHRNVGGYTGPGVVTPPFCQSPS